MKYQEQHTEAFCIDDLMAELCAYVRLELENRGKPDIEAETFRYSDDYKCRIHADRELLRRAFLHLLDNSI
jgi:signal transduction histidine kinase